MDFRLVQEQQMKLVMTNELRQAITMLQYSMHDLQQYLHDQQLENPLIELQEKRTDASTDYKTDFTSYQSEEDYTSPLDYVANTEEGLHDYLLHQIRVWDISEEMKRIVSYLALHVDENGYLHSPLQTFAEELNTSIEQTEDGVRLLQTLEPHGVGATSLKECLLLQLHYLEVRDPLTEKIVTEHLDALAKKQWQQIAKAEGIDILDVQYAADFIQSLNPKPGAAFAQEPPSYVIPDVLVHMYEGTWRVTLNNADLPKMTMNRQYEQLLTNKQKEVQDYLKNKQDQFEWIRRSIAQRQETILRVTESIIEHQEAFLTDGEEKLRPLNLKQIADRIGVHESTVSRATTKKYVQTPRGLYELKYFFTKGIGDSETASSAEKIKTYMRRLIENEPKQKPLSDQKLSDLLKAEHHIEVSRRTIAKYREEMQIAPSSKRKRYGDG
ncbi:RNA polymerase factor sigma-54 [Paenalkalicoccus suaedae]|uniref:RNA polymerase factor sigma-54 n=1 Tax=Paenalkalicoccus suaedae TaxID=2592382 RepID=A0A859FHD9_9BACI|nr:RNA polymerase factor sigma-54 [Paenalkalicoccus suaedae]QKS72248.1 RNA polymerase factor sigma-54 [Paenalkalicoccus suaedae]